MEKNILVSEWIKKKENLFFLLLFCFGILQIIWIGIFEYNNYFHTALNSDSAAEFLLPEYLFDQGAGVVSNGWAYSTEVRIFHNQLIMTPLFYFTHDYNTITTTYSVIISCLFLGCGYFCFKGLNIPKHFAMGCAVCFIVPMGASLSFASYFQIFIQTGYYSFFLIGLLLFLGIWIRFQRKLGKALLILLLAFSLLFGICGIRYLSLVIIPLCLTECIRLLTKEFSCRQMDKPYRIRREDARRFGSMILICMFWVVGFLVYRYVLQPYLGGGHSDVVQITNENNFGKNLIEYIKYFFNMSGFQYTGDKVLSTQGVLNIYLLVYGCLSFLCGIILLTKWKKLCSTVRYYVVFAWVSLLVNTMMLIFIGDAISERMVNLGYLLFYPMPILCMFDAKGCKLRKGFLILAVILAAVCCNLNIFIMDREGATRGEIANRSEYISFLKENNYEFGWAGFWDANSTTALTNGDVRVAAVQAETENMPVFEWLQPKEYTNIEQHIPEFILLTRETDQLRKQNGYITQGQVVYQDDYYVIYAFEK